MTELEKILARFANDDFKEACFDLIKYWKIKNTPYEISDFSANQFFSEKFSLSHENFIAKIKNIELICVATPDSFSEEASNVSINDILNDNLSYMNMMFFAIEASASMNRTEISHLTRAFNKINHDYPVVLFIKYWDNEDSKYRLTLSMCERSESIKYIKKDKSSRKYLKIGRVTILKGIDCKKPHPGHLNILKKLSITCSSFDELYSKWLEIFSNELLTKDFYADLYRWYQWAVEPTTGVTFPNIVGNSEDDQFDTSTSIIRLITRLLFVWFIKQKGLTPNELFEEEKLRLILDDFQPLAEDSSCYYNAILQNLFFATLNNQIDRRSFADSSTENNPHEGVKTLFRDNDVKSWFSIPHDEVLQLFRPIPFMNCGLFECLDKYADADIDTEEDNFRDGFSCSSERLGNNFKYRAFIPNKLFFAGEHIETVSVKEDNGNIKKEDIKVAGLITILNKYQFTVEENTPTDVEVSLDPELLGQVFENLLAAYDPKTRSTARKATGSFYTPRKIVEYMVNESLIEYLNSEVDSNKEDTWRAITGYEDIPFELSEEERKKVLEKILSCKILDPACGSGAFPMGMLHQMVHILRRVDPTNELWRELVLKQTQEEINKLLLERKDSKDEDKEIENRRQEVMNAFDNSVDNPDYTRKLYIIQNCIYGSDIQPIAMLISKLRFFISLICEQDTDSLDFSDSEHNYGINTLPNLETKFVAADSLANALVRDFQDDEWTIDKSLVTLKNDLLSIRQSHFMANTQEKKLIKRAEDEAKRRDIHNYILNQTINPDEAKIAQWSQQIKGLAEEREKYAEEVFEEVEITTQATLFDDAKSEFVIMDINKSRRDTIDKTIRGLEKNITKERNKENKAGFVSAVNQITSWNPYDQINPAPFFDPDWMFNVKDGFDIVIGNPPYFQTSKGRYSSKQYPYSEGKDTGKQNMYKLFVEHSYNNAKEKGIACMIVQSSLMCDKSSKHTRELLLSHTCLKQIIEFPKTAPTREGQVFASVCQGTCIYLFRKDEPDGQPFMLSVNNDCTTIDHLLKENVLQDTLMRFYPEDYAIPVLKPGEFPILNKVKNKGILFKDLCRPNEISQGDLNLTSDSSQFNGVTSDIKLIRGRHIGDFFINYNVEESVKKSFKANVVQLNHKHTYLVCQQITGLVDYKRMHFSLTDPEQTFLIGNSLNKIHLKEESNNYLIIGLLNSQLIDWIFRKTSSNNHVNCYEIIQLPILMPQNSLDKMEIENVVKEIIEIKKLDNGADISSQETALNNLVYKLYDLSYEEQKIIRKNYR